jgi:hypothetical protein
MNDIPIINIADLKDPADPQGRSYREINNARSHAIPVGALVEITHDPEYPSAMDGARLFVVMQTRDCDGTPLYELCADPEDTEQANPRFRNAKWHGGYSEESLTVIREILLHNADVLARGESATPTTPKPQ